MSAELNPLHLGSTTEDFVAAALTYIGSGNTKTAGQISFDCKTERPALALVNFMKAAALRPESSPLDVQEALAPFVGTLNADRSRRFTLTDGAYAATATS